VLVAKLSVLTCSSNSNRTRGLGCRPRPALPWASLWTLFRIMVRVRLRLPVADTDVDWLLPLRRRPH
jgi:hypothetical protein